MRIHRRWLLLAAGGCTPASFSTEQGIADVRAAFEAGRYEVAWVDDVPMPGVGPAYESRAGRVRGYLTPDRIVVVDRVASDPDWSVSLATSAWGRDPALDPVPPGRTWADGPTFESRRSGLTEWTEGTPEGIEHGYTLHRKPAGTGPVAVELAVSATGGDLRMWPTPARDGVRVAVDGRTRMSWTGLRAWDADRTPLDAEIDVRSDRIRVLVDDRDATWPITIDPLISVDGAQTNMQSDVLNSWLGYAIDSDGDRIIVGDPGQDGTATRGEAIIGFSDDISGPFSGRLSWSPGFEGFGASVALEGIHAAVATTEGHVVPYRQDLATGAWIQEGTLNPSDDGETCVNQSQRLYVDIVDERIIVGVSCDFGGGLAIYGHHTQSQDWGRIGWFDGSGISAVDGDDRLLAVGVPGAGQVRVYRYEPSGAPASVPYYTEMAVYGDPDGTGHDFGRTVALSGDWLAVGAPDGGKVHLFSSPESETSGTVVSVSAPSWASERFGASVALHQGTLAVTDLPLDDSVAPRVYVYENTGIAEWTLREAFDLTPGAGDVPLSVALSAGELAVGQHHAPGLWVWRREGTRFEEVETTSGSPNSNYGVSVVVDDDLIAIAAPLDDYNGPDRGLVEVYRWPSNDVFDPIASYSGAANNMRLGRSIDLDGDLLAIGTNLNRVWVYQIGNETYETILSTDAGIPVGSDFGASVAIDSYGLVVGAPGIGSLAVQSVGGAAVFFAAPGDTWSFVDLIDQPLTGAGANDAFGQVVEIENGIVYVGSEDADGGGTDRGVLQAYRLEWIGGVLTPVRVMTWRGANNERLASSLAIDGDRIAVGRRGTNDAGGFAIYRTDGSSTPIASRNYQTANAGYGDDIALVGDTLYLSSCTTSNVLVYRRNNLSNFAYASQIPGGCTLGATADLLVVGDAANSEAVFHRRYDEGPPTARPDRAAPVEGASVALDVLANDTDPNGDVLSVSGFQVTEGNASFVDITADGLLTFTPTENYDLPVRVRYDLSAGGDPDQGYVEIAVVPQPDAPVANDDPDGGVPYAVSFDDVLEVPAPGVLANDYDVDTGDTLTITQHSNPSAGTLDLRPDGSFTYLPNGAVGDVSFTYRVTDNTGRSDNAVVQIRVSNDPPVLGTPPVFETDEDAPIIAASPGLLASAYVTDPEGDPLRIVSLTPPAEGSLLWSESGSFLYTPAPEFSGEVTFTCAVADPYNPPVPMTVRMTIAPIDDPPVAEEDGPFSLSEDQSYRIPVARLLLNDHDVDSTNLTVVVDPTDHPPDHGTLVRVGLELIYTPDPDFHGGDTGWYQVRDGTSSSAFVPITFDVAPVNDPPEATDWDYGQIGGETVEGNVMDAHVSDVDSEDLTVSLTREPGHGQVQLDADGHFTYTPSPYYVGEDVFWYVVRDEETPSRPASVTFVVVQDRPETDPEEEGGPLGCEGVPVTWYLDADADGYGSAEHAVETCGEQPLNHVDNADDCDDTNPRLHPKATEIPDDGIDQDCDGADNVAVLVGTCSVTPNPQTPALGLALAGLLAGLRRRKS